MTDQYVEFVDYEQMPVFFEPKWWDAPRWWIIRKLGGYCPYDTVKTTRIPICGKTFAENLYKQRRALMESFHAEATTIMVGAEDFQEIMNTQDIIRAFTLSSQFNYGRQVYGLTVKVVPWMRGIVVMP